MDNKDGRKKESIDEILSDLNGLLNKMPSILDGIRMPDIKPAEFSSEPVYRTSEKPAAAPAPAPAPDDADKTVVLPAFSALREGADAPALEKLVPQSLGDFMFGEKEAEEQAKPASPVTAKLAGAPLEPPAEPPAAKRDGAGKGGLIISVFKAPEDKEPVAQPVQASVDLHEAGEDNFSLQDALPPATVPEASGAEVLFPVGDNSAADPSAGNPEKYTGTADFGVPDIDAMLLMSSDEKPAAGPAAPESAAVPPPSQGPAITEPGADELAEFEKQLQAAAPQGDAVADKPENENKEAPIEAVQEAAPEGLILEPAAAPQGDAVADKPEGEGKEAPIEVSQEAAPEGLILEPAAAQPQVEVTPDPGPQAVPEPAGGDQPAAGEIQLSVNEPAPAMRPQGEMNLSVNEPAPEARPEAGLVPEPASALPDGQSQAPSGDETLVLPPTPGAEEKTVIFEAGTSPGITSRSRAVDLSGLACKPVPEGIPDERVKAISFLYAAPDKDLCAAIISEIDAICLKSADKPMFVKRVSVKECDPEINGNYILQTVSDSGSQGLVCVGVIPQEKIYEIESAFASAGKFFRHYDSAGFNHSAALDLVLDLVLIV